MLKAGKSSLRKQNGTLTEKNVTAESVEAFDSNIKAGDFVLVTAGSLTGYGVSLVDGADFSGLKTCLSPRTGLNWSLQAEPGQKWNLQPEPEQKFSGSGRLIAVKRYFVLRLWILRHA